MSMWRVVSCVVGTGHLLWPVRSLGKTLLAFSLYSKAKFACYSRSFLIPTFAFQSAIMKMTFVCVSVCVLVLEGLVGLQRTVRLQLHWLQWLGHRLGQWFALETNQDPSVVFEIAPKYCILDSLVNYEGYSISSKGFLPTVVDIMVIWFKFAHSCPF